MICEKCEHNGKRWITYPCKECYAEWMNETQGIGWDEGWK